MGYGFSTKCFHLPFITPNPDFEVYAFLQRKEAPSKGSKVEKGVHCTIDHPQAKHYRTPEDFFADQAIDLVIVCTGVDTHAKFAEQAMRSGKHGERCWEHPPLPTHADGAPVVVEKPFTITSAESDHLIAIQKETGKVLSPFQNRRYDSDFRTLQKVLSTQPGLGEITEFQNHYDVDNPEWVQKWTSPDLEPGEGNVTPNHPVASTSH
jgi:predicted dehydrogenase